MNNLLLIKKPLIYTGLNQKPFQSDILIENDRIKKIASIKNKNIKTINAENLIATPGFIDPHSHSDIAFLDKKFYTLKLNQGYTSEITGNCGISVFPLNNKYKNQWQNIYSGILGKIRQKFSWNSFGEYLDAIKKSNCPINYFQLIGMSTLRLYVNGFADSAVSNKQIKQMQKILADFFEFGGLGLSLGLNYIPNAYCSKKEYLHIFDVVKEYNKIVSVHLQDEGATVITAIKNIINLAKKKNIKIQISHLKTLGKKNWNKMDKIINLIEKEKSNGLNIAFDLYPYSFGSTSINALIPLEYFSKGLNYFFRQITKKNIINDIRTKIKKGIKGWENYCKNVGFENIDIIGLKSAKYKNYNLMSISEIAEKEKKDKVSTLCDIIYKEKGKCSILIRGMLQDNVIKLLKHKLSIIGTDGLFNQNPHLRTSNAAICFLKDYVIDKKIMSIEKGIHKLTYGPAKRFGISKRGLIKKDYYADINLIDMKMLKTNNNLKESLKSPTGIKNIIINGKLIK